MVGFAEHGAPGVGVKWESPAWWPGFLFLLLLIVYSVWHNSPPTYFIEVCCWIGVGCGEFLGFGGLTSDFAECFREK